MSSSEADGSQGSTRTESCPRCLTPRMGGVQHCPTCGLDLWAAYDATPAERPRAILPPAGVSWRRAVKIGSVTGLILAVVGTIANVSAASRFGPVTPADMALHLLIGAVIYVPAGIAIAAAVLRFRPRWGQWRVAMATALGVFLLLIAIAALMLSADQPGQSVVPSSVGSPGNGAATEETSTPDATQEPTVGPTQELTVYDQCLEAIEPLIFPIRRLDTTYSTTGLEWPDEQAWLAEARDAAFNLNIDEITSVERRCAAIVRELGSTLTTLEEARDAWGRCVVEMPPCNDEERQAAHDASRELRHRAREQLRMIDEALDALRS